MALVQHPGPHTFRRSALFYSQILSRVCEQYVAQTKCKSPRALEVGAGNCHFILHAPPDRWIRIGLDLHSHHHTRGTTFRDFLSTDNSFFVFGDALSMPFADEMFDVVISNEFVSHVASIDRALAEQLRVCKRGGYILILDSNLLCPVNLVGNFALDWLAARQKALADGGLRRLFRRDYLKRGGLKWLLRRHQPIVETTDRAGRIVQVCWCDENIHTVFWWKKQLEHFPELRILEMKTAWSFLPTSWFSQFANKVLIWGQRK